MNFSFKKLFRSNIVKFDKDETKLHVSVMDTAMRYPEKNKTLFAGHIYEIDFKNREVVIRRTRNGLSTNDFCHVSFCQIVTISRMDDGRLRMWIKVKED